MAMRCKRKRNKG